MNQLGSAYSFARCSFHLSADSFINATTNLEAVSLWRDKIQNIPFFQTSAAAQPRLIVPDINFNNNPVVEFIAGGRLLDSLIGMPISVEKTVAFVYQYNTYSSGVHYNSSIVRNNNYLSSRTLGNNFGSQCSNASVVRPFVGYYQGSQYEWASGDSVIFNTFPVIVVINKNCMIANGVNLPMSSQLAFQNQGFVANVIGGPATFANAFKLAEWIVWESLYDLSECLDISDLINQKYAIY